MAFASQRQIHRQIRSAAELRQPENTFTAACGFGQIGTKKHVNSDQNRRLRGITPRSSGAYRERSQIPPGASRDDRREDVIAIRVASVIIHVVGRRRLYAHGHGSSRLGVETPRLSAAFAAVWRSGGLSGSAATMFERRD
jgi:hypothetical protein